MQAAAAGRKKLIPALPDKYNTPNAIIAKVILVALLSVWVSSLFHDAINKLVWCLIFGVLCKELGFLDEDALGKAHATGIVMPIITLSIFTNLASATPEMVGGMVEMCIRDRSVIVQRDCCVHIGGFPNTGAAR